MNRARQTRESGLSEDLGRGWRLLVVSFQAVPIGVAPFVGAPALVVLACAWCPLPLWRLLPLAQASAPRVPCPLRVLSVLGLRIWRCWVPVPQARRGTGVPESVPMGNAMGPTAT